MGGRIFCTSTTVEPLPALKKSLISLFSGVVTGVGLNGKLLFQFSHHMLIWPATEEQSYSARTLSHGNGQSCTLNIVSNSGPNCSVFPQSMHSNG